MREETAETVANVVIGIAAIGAAIVILRVPTLRRLAFGLAKTAIITGIPAWLSQETKRAWAETAHSEPRTASPSGGSDAGAARS